MMIGHTSQKEWDNLVRTHLLGDGLINGVLLLTHNLSHVYSYGLLNHVPEEQYMQLRGIFQVFGDAEKESKLLQTGFVIDIADFSEDTSVQGDGLTNRTAVKFVIRKLNYHSIYATSHRNQHGVILMNLPMGILIASHSYPVHSSVAAQQVEDVCMLLRT